MNAAQAIRRSLAVAGFMLAVSCALATLGAAFADSLWIGELLVHFRLQYGAVALCAAGLLWAGQRRWLAVLTTLIAAVNGFAFAEAVRAPRGAVASLLASATASQAVPSRSALTLRVAAANVFYGNSAYQPLIDWVRDERPDLLVIAEVTPKWLAALDALAGEYPYRLVGAGSGGFRTVLLSRHAFVAWRSTEVPVGAGRMVGATLVLSGQSFEVFGVHATWPATPTLAAARNREFADLAAMARRSRWPVILLGDLNVSPLSPHFRHGLLAASGLRSAAAGSGWQPTWPAFFLPAGIQIDHVLLSSAFQVREFRRGPWIGSDHLPIVADLALVLPAASAAAEPPASIAVETDKTKEL